MELDREGVADIPEGKPQTVQTSVLSKGIYGFLSICQTPHWDSFLLGEAEKTP